MINQICYFKMHSTSFWNTNKSDKELDKTLILTLPTLFQLFFYTHQNHPQYIALILVHKPKVQYKLIVLIFRREIPI